MQITYLMHSGFMVRDGENLFLFDDYDDPTKIADRAVDEGNFKRLYILTSHAHFDHFGTHIADYAEKVSRYIFGNDIRRTKRVKTFPREKIIFLKRYTDWQDDKIKVTAFDSTDVGVSFLVETAQSKIFHAGDFNWWHWEDDPDEKNFLAEKLFRRQLEKLKGLEVDAAFFPVDGRLGYSQEKGVIEFIKTVKTSTLIAMHRASYPRWQPSQNFLDVAPSDLKIFAPVNTGEIFTI